jgi:large subunit ribosomal protein L27
MSTKKSAGSTSLGRDSQSQRLGVKLFDGEIAKPGSIIIRQRGTKYRIGKNVKRGTDDTIFSMIKGSVKFSSKKVRLFDNRLVKKTFVNVLPQEKK